MDICVICGYEGTTEKDRYGNYIHYRYREPVCRACEEDYSLELDAGIRPSSLLEGFYDTNRFRDNSGLEGEKARL